jgi:hypothetical protein
MNAGQAHKRGMNSAGEALSFHGNGSQPRTKRYELLSHCRSKACCPARNLRLMWDSAGRVFLRGEWKTLGCGL